MTDFQREIASLSEQSEEFREIENAHKHKLAELFVNILSGLKNEIRVSDLKTASYIILTTVEAVIHDTCFHNNGENKEAIIRELTQMVLNYLFK